MLSFKLMQLINSAFYRRSQKIQSLWHAITLLGIERIRHWATLIQLGQAVDKPHELQREALTRAFLCEQLAGHLAPDEQDRFFTVGLLSVLDAWLDQPLDSLLAQLPLADDIQQALTQHKGLAGSALKLALAYGHSQWSELSRQLPLLKDLSDKQLAEQYYLAIDRADELLGR